MIAASHIRFVFSLLLLTASAIGQAQAQGTMRRPTPESEDRDSSGNLKKDDSVRTNETTARGEVVLADGSAPQELVSIYGDCGGVQILVAFADSKGTFSFNPSILDDVAKPNGCALHIVLAGYRAETRNLTDINQQSGKKLGKFVLQPLTPDTNGLVSSKDEQAEKPQRKRYEKALDEAAKSEWANSIASLQKVTSAYQDYSSAWLTLGIIQKNRGDLAGARKSFLESVRADPKFAPPLIQMATAEAVAGNWRPSLDYSQKAIELNPAAFPDAYALNAMGNVNLQNIDAAEKSAREGLKLDTEHRYPELEYALGLILVGKNDVQGAATYLRSYLSRAPRGPNAEAAKSELAQLQKSAAPLPEAVAPDRIAQPATSGPAAGSGPKIDRLRDQNAALLVNTPAHTCLESISRRQIDPRSRPHDDELIRVEIAVSGDKEIYGLAGKRFSNDRLPEIFGYTFSTTGLFNSIACALIAGNNAEIAFGGQEALNGEAVFRYNFHVSPSLAGWSIQYGKESGLAGEEGSFLVDSTNLILRRVAVHAIDMSRNLKLKKLDAVIDYEPETIADRRVLLPYMAEVRAEEGSGMQRVSRMFFDHCRAFTAESVLSFDLVNPQTQGEQRPEKLELPPDLDVPVSLLAPVSATTAAANDVLTASITAPVLSKGHEIIARGAVLEGHVRARRGESAVVIEFDRVQTRSGWAPFYARLVSLNSTTQAAIESARPQRKAKHSEPESVGSAAMADPEIPGVAKISFASPSAELAVGTQMIWRTESLVAPAAATSAPQLSTTMGLR